MELVWGVSDIFNGLMAVPNVIGGVGVVEKRGRNEE